MKPLTTAEWFAVLHAINLQIKALGELSAQHFAKGNYGASDALDECLGELMNAKDKLTGE